MESGMQQQRTGFDLPTTQRLHELITEYARLQRLDGCTAQSRGQRFNSFIAELLQCWEVDRVEANVRSVGEVDVTFVVDGVRFVLEAKWEQPPIDFGPLAKLRGRITQRFTGTRGVFLSMSGYTAEAEADLARGHQPDMLLLDRTHFESMLAGLTSPQELFSALVDRASFRGEVHTSLADVVIPRTPPKPPVLRFSPPSEYSTVGIGGYPAEVIFEGPESLDIMASGLAVDANGQLLLTTTSGVGRINLETGSTDWAVPLAGIKETALLRPDGSLLVVCGASVLRWDGDTFQLLAGGFTGHASLLAGADG